MEVTTAKAKLSSALHNAHLEGASFLWEAGSVGVVLSHGYTATTAEVRLLGRILHERGYTVAGPLLPGHGTTSAAMNRCRWQDWAAAVEDSYLQLAEQCEHVFVGGESMGALLALYVASKYSEIAGILAYSPALKIPRKVLAKAYLARLFIAEVVKSDLKNMNKNWQGYPVNPVPALLQLHRLQREISRRLPQIKQPLLIVQGRLDRTVDLHGIDLLHRHSGTDHKQLHWLEKSGHVIILEDELDQIADLTLQFMEEVLQNKVPVMTSAS